MGIVRNGVPFLRPVACLAVALAVVLTILFFMHHTRLLFAAGNVSSGVPLVGNNDGYFHLDQARAIVSGGKGLLSLFSEKKPSMLLAHILAAVAGSDRGALEHAASFAGPVMSLTMLLAVLPWAMEMRSRFIVLFSPIFAVLAPYWMVRTHIGMLDTDGLAPALVMGGLFCLYRVASSETHRWGWGLGYSCVLAFLWFWWRPGAYLELCFLGLLIVCPGRNRGHSVLRYVFAGCLLLIVGAALSGIKPFAYVLEYGLSHARLAFGGGTGALLSNAIRELHGLNFFDLGEKSLGAVWLLGPAVFGAGVYGYRQRSRSVFLLSGWLFCAASLLSERFLVLFIPVAALCCTYGVFIACQWLAGKLDGQVRTPSVRIASALLVVCLPGLFFGSVSKALEFKPRQYFSKEDVVLARVLRESFPKNTVIWTWWDYGYFFKYMTGMEVLFDGGSQTNASCFVGAYPLVQDDPELAAAWMKFYSVHSPESINQLMKGAKWDAYLKSLEKVVREYTADGREVALCLPRHVFDSNGFLVAFASAFGMVPQPVSNHLDLFPKQGFFYDPQARVVDVPEVVVRKGYAGFGAVLDATGKTPRQYGFDVIADPYLIFSNKAPFLAVTDKVLVRSILFRLLGLFDVPGSFETVTFDYRSGGVWRVR